MKITPTKTPLLAKKMFPNYIWDLPSDSKTLYLTFDDGPTPEITNWTLDVLDQYNAKATFFIHKENTEKVDNYQKIIHEILKRGHELGNHTSRDVKSISLSEEEFKQEFEEADAF